jgi:hypothetical protein
MNCFKYEGWGIVVTSLIHYYDHVFIVFTSLFFFDQNYIFVKNLILKAAICKAHKLIKVLLEVKLL